MPRNSTNIYGCVKVRDFSILAKNLKNMKRKIIEALRIKNSNLASTYNKHQRHLACFNQTSNSQEISHSRFIATISGVVTKFEVPRLSSVHIADLRAT